MSLDIYLRAVRKTTVYENNITHNLAAMADAAGIYRHPWRPEESRIPTAEQLIAPLTEGLEKLKADPEKFQKLDSPNGWGTYAHFVPFVEQYLEACLENPDAEIEASR